MAAQPSNAQDLYLTVSDDDENQVLELVRTDESGKYIRDGGKWWRLADNSENDRVWDRVIVEVDEPILAVYDDLQKQGPVTVEDLEEFVLEDTV